VSLCKGTIGPDCFATESVAAVDVKDRLGPVFMSIVIYLAPGFSFLDEAETTVFQKTLFGFKRAAKFVLSLFCAGL